MPEDTQALEFQAWCDGLGFIKTEGHFLGKDGIGLNHNNSHWKRYRPNIQKKIVYVQFTGRRDRNNAKIYDQNFIEFKDYYNKQTQIGKVFWANDLGQWLVKSYLWEHAGSFRFEDIKFETVEVIGSALTHKLVEGNKRVISRDPDKRGENK